MRVLAAGAIPPNPSEPAGSKAMGALVEKLSQDALVILDAPPLLPVTDAAVLTAIADGALIVISSGKTVDAELGTALVAPRGRPKARRSASSSTCRRDAMVGVVMKMGHDEAETRRRRVLRSRPSHGWRARPRCRRRRPA